MSIAHRARPSVGQPFGAREPNTEFQIVLHDQILALLRTIGGMTEAQLIVGTGLCFAVDAADRLVTIAGECNAEGELLAYYRALAEHERDALAAFREIVGGSGGR